MLLLLVVVVPGCPATADASSVAGVDSVALHVDSHDSGGCAGGRVDDLVAMTSQSRTLFTQFFESRGTPDGDRRNDLAGQLRLTSLGVRPGQGPRDGQAVLLLVSVLRT
ncbi:hypothetical protein [Pseudonocardia sp. GCM10023141]|uniref:hypothetical protein n=1 Tax=Pseudonocardia sp. GCM10023141 TaxID=3252653 RepID=UPI00361AC6C8